MDLYFSKFEFLKKTSVKSFHKYRIINKNPYNQKNDYLGMSVKNTIQGFKENRKGILMFVFARNNEYLFTYDEINKIPESDDYSIEYVSYEEVPLDEENLDLYKEWVQYYVYITIVSYCNINRNAFDYRIINKYSSLLDTPDNSLGVIIKRLFNVSAEVLIDGTAYLNVDFKCEFESRKNIYDLIKSGKDVVGMTVNCKWQRYNKSYTITKVFDKKISEDVEGFNLIDYWSSKKDLSKIDKNAPAIEVYDTSKGYSYYIPQSLKPVITRSYISSNDKLLSKQVEKYTKLSMDKRIRIIIDEFLKALNYKEKIIKIDPVSVERCNYSVIDYTQKMPKLIIGNNTKISFGQKFKAFTQGFYRNPKQPIIAAFLSYEQERNQSHEVIKKISKFANTQTSNKENCLLPISFLNKTFLYQKGDSLSYKEVALQIKKNDKVNFVLSALPIEDDEEDFFDENTSPYDNFKKILADLSIPSQMVSNAMYKEINNSSIQYRLQNIILGILCKSGGIPWVLENQLDDIDCFIGLDVGTQEKGIHYPACSVCLDGKGNLISYYSTNVAQKGEKINNTTLQNVFDNVLIGYKNANGILPKHIVLHRDGFSNEECDWYERYFGQKNIEFDIVEIRKNISTRLFQRDNVADECNPKSGCAIIKGKEAYLVSTSVKPFLGAPRPLLLEHKYGNLSMESLVRQVYILSEMHGGSMRTSRLPLTTLYADKICKAHDYVPHDKLSNSLYFL